MRCSLVRLLGVAVFMLWGSAGWAQEDLLIADFEQATYADWTVEGEAFGKGPVEGTLPGQMHVSGFQGSRLVNSFNGGDKPQGRLQSPKFRIERNYIRFLIGGGGFAGKTCIQLWVEDKKVRESVGPNSQQGGSEALGEEAWDVQEFLGQMAFVRIVDEASGGWGHINIDAIVQTQKKPARVFQRRDVRIDQDHLVIPIKNGAPKVQLEVFVDSHRVRSYETELGPSREQADWMAALHLGEHLGKQARIEVSKASEESMQGLSFSKEHPQASFGHREKLRPQLRFSQWSGWINDPNGMVYLDGEWHLFFQHNPVGWSWGNMTWGHAVSSDLVHWKQLPDCFFPNVTTRGACFSGGGAIDLKNTAGWKQGDQDAMVVFLTDTGAGESMAYSLDRGRTFHWYSENPIVKHQGRDPKVLWYTYTATDSPLDAEAKKAGGHWVMAVYDERTGHERNIAFYTSNDLKKWELQSHMDGYYECPELFALPIPNARDKSKWVLFAADGQYALGDFDGRRFQPDHPGKHRLHYGNFYASQTFENAPNQRRIQMGWMQGLDYPGMPFNQAFSFPHELALHETKDGLRLQASPIAELEKLVSSSRMISRIQPSSEMIEEVPVSTDLLYLEVEFELGDAAEVGIQLGEHEITYRRSEGKWQDVPAPLVDNRVRIKVLVDRSIVEFWANDGLVVKSGPRKGADRFSSVKFFSRGGKAKQMQASLKELKSIWDISAAK